jgi:hypothetical protein
VYDISLFIPEGICQQTTRKGKKTKHAHKNMEINGNTTKTAKQIPSGIKSEIPYTPEDGHVGRNM